MQSFSSHPWLLVMRCPADAIGQHKLSHSLSLVQWGSYLSFHFCVDLFGKCLIDNTLPWEVSHNLIVWSLLPDTTKCPLAAVALSCSGPKNIVKHTLHFSHSFVSLFWWSKNSHYTSHLPKSMCCFGVGHQAKQWISLECPCSLFTIDKAPSLEMLRTTIRPLLYLWKTKYSFKEIKILSLMTLFFHLE